MNENASGWDRGAGTHQGVRQAPECGYPASNGERFPLEFRVFGAIEALDAGRAVELGSRKQRAALGLLAANVGQPVPIEVLVEEVWLGAPPHSVRSSLQSHVSRLRGVLGGRHVLQRHGAAYSLQVPAGSVDAWRFDEAEAAGRQLLKQGADAAAMDALDHALSLWTGQPYADLQEYPYAQREANRLEMLRLDVIENRAQAMVDLGWHVSADIELQQAWNRYPTRERLAGQLMRVLYRTGRQADALAVYHETRARLADDLGIDTCPELKEIYLEVLRHSA
ncbi:MAG: AfsR/SARP family transcriptional regulator [Egibacteraceae bacterium]